MRCFHGVLSGGVVVGECWFRCCRLRNETLLLLAIMFVITSESTLFWGTAGVRTYVRNVKPYLLSHYSPTAQVPLVYYVRSTP